MKKTVNVKFTWDMMYELGEGLKVQLKYWNEIYGSVGDDHSFERVTLIRDLIKTLETKRTEVC